MRAELTGLVVYDSVLFQRTGHIGRWAARVESAFTRNARTVAPVNKRMNKGVGALPPGSMKASISGTVERFGRVVETTISVDVPYALYVIKGTGTIFAEDAGREFMKLPSNPGFGTRTRHKVVSGQRANNFLATAGSMTAKTHSSLRGFANPVNSI